MKKAVIVALSLFMILALTSCGIGKLLVKAMEQDASLLVGTWESEVNSIILEFTEDQMRRYVKGQEAESKFVNYRTKINSLYIERSSGTEEAFTYQVSKDRLVLSKAMPGGVYSEEYNRVK